jgi:DNA primase small subunit
MPLQLIYELLTTCTSLAREDAFALREFTLGFVTDSGQDGFNRFNQYTSVEELRAALLRYAPQTLYTGSILDTPTCYMKLGIAWAAISSLERELLFDIDITDYEELRACCVGKSLCNSCWQFLAIAARSVEFLMRHKFGLRRFLWVFSGRRGIHCWALDRQVAQYSTQFRTAIANYLSPQRVNAELRMYRQHCSLVEELYKSQLQSSFESLLPSLKRESLREYVQCAAEELGCPVKFPLASSSVEQWSKCKMILRRQHRLAESVIRRTVLSITMPRLDVNITTNRKHLIRCPLAWHGKTQLICVPFFVDDIAEFDVQSVPRINEPYSFANFERWLAPLRTVLSDTGEGQSLVCTECFGSRPLAELSRELVFETEEQWLEHTSQHTGEPSAALLCELIDRELEGQHSAMRLHLYKQLRDRCL